MRPDRLIIAALVLGFSGQVALAFQETTIGGGEQKAPAAQVLEVPKGPLDVHKGPHDHDKSPALSGSELNIARTTGTDVRTPGLGTVSVLPKLDFGLELLYGANEQKGLHQDKTSPDDVQIRGTIKHRF